MDTPVIRYDRVISSIKHFPLLHPNFKEVLFSSIFFETTKNIAQRNDNQAKQYLNDLEKFVNFFLNYNELTAFTFNQNLLGLFEPVDHRMDQILETYPEVNPELLLQDFITCFVKTLSVLDEEAKLMKEAYLLISSEELSVTVPHIRLLIREFPNCRYAESFRLYSKEFCKYFDLFSASMFNFDIEQPFSELIESAIKLFKYYELSRYHFSKMDLPVEKKFYLHNGFISATASEHFVTKINRWYYGIQGVLLYKDFDTKASLSPELAYADAVHFSKCKFSAETVKVLECGIGDGKFGIDFLDGLKGDFSGLYERTSYTFCDFSEKLLESVKKKEEFKEHINHVNLRQLNFLEFDYPEKLSYLRFHELFDDVPQNQIIYKDEHGNFHELLWRFFLKNPTEKDVDIFNDLERFGINTQFASEINEMLQKVSWEFEVSELSPETYRFYDILENSTSGKLDYLFVFNYGVLSTLENLGNFVEDQGRIMAFDYGTYHDPIATKESLYHEVSQINRRFGASITNDVNYTALEVWAKKKGYRTKVWAEEDFLEEHLGFEVLDPQNFSSLNQLMRHSRTIKGTLNAKNVRFGHTKCGSYSEYVKQLKDNGQLDNNLSYPFDETLSNFDNLIVNNDFYTCAIFNRYNLNYLYSYLGGAWFSEQLNPLLDGLQKLGYCDSIFREEKEKRLSTSLWTIELKK